MPDAGDAADSDRAALADVSLALSLFALDPAGTGLLIRGGLTPLRERMLERLAALLAASSDGEADDGVAADPWRRVPLGISDDRLLGGLDLAATLARGRAVTARGLLAEADGGVVLLPLVEQLPQTQVAQLCAVLDDGRLRLAREGVTETLFTRFGVLALDEGAESDERCAPSLSDRLLLHVRVPPVSVLTGAFDALDLASAAELRAARARLAGITLPDHFAEVACAAAFALGVDSLRAARGVLHVARLLTALVGEQTVSEDAVATAARLVLSPRATRIPAPPPEEEPEAQDEMPPEQPETPPEDGEAPPDDPIPDDDDTPELDLGPETEMLIAAAAAAVPPDVLAALAAGPASGGARRAGRAGAEAKGVARGRPAGVRQGAPKRGERLSVVDTLRAASPWQGLRGRSGPEQPVQVRAEDFRVVRRRARLPTLTVFVVDASGSAAVQRLAEAKGAVELLLADCYVRRDEVAVVAFRGDSAEVLLPPTRSLLRARRSVAGLPGGGGTPLAAGLLAAQQLADDAVRRGATPVLVLLTDGRANVTLEGQGDRRTAREEANTVARRIAATGQPAVVIDTSRRPGAAAAELAKALAADYRPLPLADASAVSEAVRAVQEAL